MRITLQAPAAPGARQPAFTLVELLVGISIIGLLPSFLPPAVQAAREAARLALCQSQLRQLGLALHSYHDAQATLPSGRLGPTAEQGPGWDWASSLLPQLEQQNLLARVDRNRLIADASNQFGREQLIPVFFCPSDPQPRRFLLAAATDHDDHDPGDELHDPAARPSLDEEGPHLFFGVTDELRRRVRCERN